MARMRRPVLASLSAVIAVGATALLAAPAFAASASGSILCAGTYSPHLVINSSTSGSGSWQNRTTGAVSYLYFPGGQSTKVSPFQSVNWVVNNGSGFFYSAPAQSCSA